jgi:hypothetical protein
MALRALIPWLLAALAASACLMIAAAAGRSQNQSAWAAALFSGAMIAAGWAINAPRWRTPASHEAPGTTPRLALAHTTILSTLVYAWSAATMLLVYTGTSLHWRHGWQYGLGLGFIAATSAAYAWRLSRAHDVLASQSAIETAIKLAAFQGLAIASVLLWMLSSDKLNSGKGDWVANHIFLGGGFAILCLSMFAVKTHTVLTQNAQ